MIKNVSETIKNEAKEQKGGFLGMLLGTLDASLLVNLSKGKGVMRAGEETIRAGENFYMGHMMQPTVIALESNTFQKKQKNS